MMNRAVRGIFFPLLLTICLICGCSGRITSGGNFSAVVFSDVHFDPFYDPALFPKLVAADAGEWENIFKSSSVSAPSGWGSGANYPLLTLALSSVRHNSQATPFALFTGDILVHKFAQTFFTLYGSQDSAAMKAFADKTVAFFLGQVRSSVGSIPVMFAIGNNDSYADLGPDALFLANTAELFYSKLVQNSAERQEFFTTYKQGGYYSAKLPEANLVVIGLNTIPFSPLALGNNDNAVSSQLAWLDAKLASARADGKKVWLLMHVPPGADIYKSASQADGNGESDTSRATMMWKEDYQAAFLRILSNYHDVISMTLAGHTHMDEYRILPSSETVEITPSIGTRSGNNPAFKIFTVASDTLKATDYRTLAYDLAAQPAAFSDYYRFSGTYSSNGFLNDALEQLFPALVTDSAKQERYKEYYYSGHNASNPITSGNWPFYWCGIGNMEQQAFIDCVNSY